MPARLPRIDASLRDNHARPRSTSGDNPRIRVPREQPRMQQIRLDLAEQSPQSQQRHRIEPHPLVDQRDRDPRRTEFLLIRPGAGEHDHVRLELVPRESRRQQRELLLRSGLVERGDQQGEFDHRRSDIWQEGAAGPRSTAAIRRESGQGNYLSRRLILQCPLVCGMRAGASAHRRVCRVICSALHEVNPGDGVPIDESSRPPMSGCARGTMVRTQPRSGNLSRLPGTVGRSPAATHRILCCPGRRGDAPRPLHMESDVAVSG